MLSKTKKLLFLTTGLAGALVVSSAAGVALSACTVEAVSGGSSSDSITLPDTWYSKDINWTDATSLNNLIIDKQGFVYSNKYMTEIIAILPGYESSDLVIPSTVTSITGYNNVTTTTTDGETTTTKTPTGAFEGIESITNVKFAGSKITTIGARAFASCTSLQSVTLPSSITTIDTYAFYGCSVLNTINLSNIQYIGISAFANAMSDVPSGSMSLDLNKTVFIGASAFENATGIASVDFSKNTVLTRIAEEAFSGCTELSSDIDLSNATKLVTLGSSTDPSTSGSTFANTAITNVYLPSTLRTIAASTFSGCSNLVNVGPKGNTVGFTGTEGITGIYNQAFAGTNIASVNISSINSTTPLQAGAFSGMTNLTNVNLGATIITIPAACFMNCTALTTLSLPASITTISGGSPTSYGNSSAFSITLGDSASNFPPFYSSGLTSIDLSTVTSYQTTSGSTLSLPDTLFYNATNLESVILKEGTTSIGSGSFANTTALTSISTGSTTTSSGYIAEDDITSVAKYAFWQSGISSVDLSAITNSSYSTLPYAIFTNCSNLTSIKLPSTIVIINDYSVTTPTKLESVNFDALTKLTTIGKGNFSSSLITDIDLSNSQLTSVDTGSFVGLLTTAEVSFPTTLASGFRSIFTDTNSNTIPFNFPNGINSGLLKSTSGTTYTFLDDNGVLKDFGNTSITLTGAANVLRNVGQLNLSNNSTMKSIGTYTFFGSAKLKSLTLPTSSIDSSTNIFIASDNVEVNSNNINEATSYTSASIPLGSNELFTSLNYTGFTSVATSNGEDDKENLFLTTSEAWTQVSKIINSLSYQAYPTTSDEASKLKPNMSDWSNGVGNTYTDPINADAEISFSDSIVTIKNSFSSEGNNGDITIENTTSTMVFIHNGITWTYTNDGSTIKLTGEANMYKATNSSSSSYLVFFNETTYSITDGSNTTYYVPSQTPVNVTLTIATASSNS